VDRNTEAAKASTDTATEVGMSNMIADPSTAAMKSKTTADPAAGATKAEDKRLCTESTKSEAVAANITGAVDTAAKATEGADNLSQAFNELPQSSAAPAHKPNHLFVDCINSFRYSSRWYSPSKVLP